MNSSLTFKSNCDTDSESLTSTSNVLQEVILSDELMSATATDAPAHDSFVAIALPMPLAPPVNIVLYFENVIDCL